MAVDWTPEEANARVRAGATRGVIAGVEMVLERGTQLILSPPKTGRIYRRRGVAHQASAPGEAPANDLGALAASGRAIYPAPEPTRITGYANWSTKYAIMLELGTERMAPRPFARRSLDERTPEIRTVIQASVSAALRG